MGTKKSRSGSQYNPKGVTQGTTLVCHRTGDPIDCIEDVSGVKRLAVDTTLTFPGSIAVELDGVDPNGDSVHIVDATTGNKLVINADGSISANVEVDAADGDNIAVSAHPDPIFDEASDTIATDSFEQIYSYTSSNTRTRIISIECSINTTSWVRVKIGSDIIRELRISPMKRNVVFTFREHRPLGNGETISVEAKVDKFFSNNSPYNTFTSLEGYLI